MADRSAEPWYATAAYLYVLHLDSPALAWEYLRRHPDYRRDWLRFRRQPDVAGHWGCACWKIPPWMRGTRTRPGSPITMPWCSSTRMPILHPTPCALSSGSYRATNT